jgi:predicted nucleotidyltransferase
MTEQEQQVSEYVVTQLVRSFPVQRIILFGSRTRGDATKDSDYDLLVVMETDEKPSRRGMELRQKARFPRIPMDFMVRTPLEWEIGFRFKRKLCQRGQFCLNAEIDAWLTKAHNDYLAGSRTDNIGSVSEFMLIDTTSTCTRELATGIYSFAMRLIIKN